MPQHVNFFFKFIYLFLRVGRGRERERERTASRLCTVSTEPDMGLEPMNREVVT